MASRLKEDEKNEKILRGLSKLPANRRCINCNSQGTQYVCTNFATFICINCSGIHREFTHRVKSISMAKFTPQEITALQEGGNERAKGIYFKGWDFERQSLPDSSNIDKLRDFIKHIYVDQRFVGERNADKPPIAKVERENSNRGRSSSPPFDSEQSSKKDTAAAVNRTTSSSSDTLQDAIRTTSQTVKEDPVAAPPVRILEPPKLEAPSTSRTPAPAAPVQSIKTESNVKDTSTPNPPEVKPVSSINLIDFDMDPQTVSRQNTQTTSNQNQDVGWASFDTQRPSFAADPSSISNNLETSLVQQPASGPVPGITYSKMSSPNNIAHQNNVSLFSKVQPNNPQLNGSPAVRPTIQSWGQTVAPNIHTTTNAPNHASLTREPPQQFMNTAAALPLGVTPLQATASPASPNGSRRALPENLFSMVYAPPQAAPMPGWNPAVRIPMGYTMQFPTPSPGQQFVQPVHSMNPFDVSSVHKLAHASTFPSMSSMQGALPNLNSGNHNAFSRSGSMDSYGAQWAQQQYQPSFPMASHPSQYSAQPHANNMVQQMPNNAYYPGNQALGGYGTVNGGYGLLGMNPQQLSFSSQRPGNTGTSPSVGGNPFA